MSDLVTLSHLSKRFDAPGGWLSKPRSMMAVRDVSLAVPKGGVVGVVGESGCGKSTLARLVLRLLDASAGEVTFDGINLTTLPKRELRMLRRRMGMVFQDPYSSLDPRFTVADVLTEPFAVQGASLPANRIAILLDQVGLTRSMASSYPHQLSGGQRQRVGIARALAMQPDFVVLDEPTASLDVSIQAQIIALLQALQGELGLTYLFISHDLGLVRYFCSSIMVMYLGAIVEELPHPQAAPRHPYTAALIASNFIPDPVHRKTIAPLAGEIRSAFILPKGCAFAARCAHATDRCRTEVPALITDRGHRHACFHPL